MTASLLVNLTLLVMVGMLLVWYPDRLSLVPLILSRVNTPPPEPPREEKPRRAARRRPGPKPTARPKVAARPKAATKRKRRN